MNAPWVHRCRSCGSKGLVPVLELGHTPLANRLLDDTSLTECESMYPLDLVFCEGCTLVQITETVSPELLFGHYLYFSSFSDTVLAHAEAHVDTLIQRYGLGPNSRVVELASNDGYLLQYFQQRGVPVLGVEPARNVAKVANNKGIPTLNAFFGTQCAEEMLARGQSADVVLGNNVLAHVADLNGFVEGAAKLVGDHGVVVFEFPYVAHMIERLEFDTIYHEHLCYFSAHAIDALFQRHGLTFTDVEHLCIHGGSLRVTASRTVDPDGRARVEDLLVDELEKGLHARPYYRSFAWRVERLERQLMATLRRLKRNGARIVAYGASAKGSTLLNAFALGSDYLDYVVDRSTVKQGLYTPGTRLPICDPARLTQDNPDYALLLSWNFADEIIAQQQEWRAQGGRFIVPIPDVHIL